MDDKFLNDWDMASGDRPDLEDPYFCEPEPECTCVEIYVDVDRTESFGPCDVHYGGGR